MAGFSPLPCKKRHTETGLNEVAFQGSILIKIVVLAASLQQSAEVASMAQKGTVLRGRSHMKLIFKKSSLLLHPVRTRELFLQFRLGTAVIRSVSAFWKAAAPAVSPL
jgi:hypothetical protein